MRKKRTRYSSSLAADWVVPVSTEIETSTDAQVAPERQSPSTSGEGPANEAVKLEHHSQLPKLLSEAEASKKRSRYKKPLPSSWVTSEFEDSPDAESHILNITP